MACTTLLVGRRATNDGSTIVARNEDGEDFSFDPKKMIVVMPEDQPRTYTGVASHLTIELPDNPLPSSSLIRSPSCWIRFQTPPWLMV